MIDLNTLEQVLQMVFEEMLAFILALWLGVWAINIIGRYLYDKLNNNYDE